jgi:hypothetical protein
MLTANVLHFILPTGELTDIDPRTFDPYTGIQQGSSRELLGELSSLWLMEAIISNISFDL